MSDPARSASRAAEELWTAARDGEQAVRRVEDDVVADQVRTRVRALAREEGIRIRSARLGDLVVVVRLDAAIWDDDTATMRRKLAPTDEPLPSGEPGHA